MNLSAITFDIDWAPDFVIDEVAQYLIDNRVKATWFVTHESAAIKRLFNHPDIFEFGIHPNFLPFSTHGKDDASIIRHIAEITPKTNIVRTHALVQSSKLLHHLANEGFNVDVSLFLRESPNIEPHHFYIFDKVLTRVPYFWEDDLETYNPKRTWNFKDSNFHVNGLKIFNFHPMYVYLNMDTMEGYEALKKKKHLPEATYEDCLPFINQKEGVNTFFRQLINYCKNEQEKSFFISEIVELWDQKPSS